VTRAVGHRAEQAARAKLGSRRKHGEERQENRGRNDGASARHVRPPCRALLDRSFEPFDALRGMAGAPSQEAMWGLRPNLDLERLVIVDKRFVPDEN
jgi:hypothetical protein